MKIGIFDSGIGGLSVLHQAIKKIPNASFIYYADQDHVPYGEKTKEEINEFTKNIIDFLINKGVDIVLIACNTATSSISMSQRNQYSVPIVGMEPAVKVAIDQKRDNKRILVVATEVTINGEKLKKLIDKYDTDHEVDTIALTKLVHFAEEKNFKGNEIETYLKEKLSNFNMNNYSYIVLGCTHFIYFKKQFKKLFPHIKIVDGNLGTVNQLIRLLPDNKKDNFNVEFYISGVRQNNDETYNEYFQILDNAINIE